MTKIPDKSSYFNAALAVSFLTHLVAFGVAVAVQSKAQHGVIKEYVPVELVNLPSTPRYVRPAPVASRRAVAPKPSEAPAPVVNKERTEPTSPPALTPAVQRVAALQQPHNEAPAAGSLPQPRTVAAHGEGTAGKELSRATGNIAPSSGSGTGAPQSQKRSKGDYLAFHRLTRLPLAKVKAEPVYPNTERMAGGEARVLAEIYLDEQGTVDEVVIKKSGGRLFDRAVIDAARKSSFHPGYMGEKAVPTVIQIPYTFKLK